MAKTKIKIPYIDPLLEKETLDEDDIFIIESSTDDFEKRKVKAKYIVGEPGPPGQAVGPIIIEYNSFDDFPLSPTTDNLYKLHFDKSTGNSYYWNIDNAEYSLITKKNNWNSTVNPTINDNNSFGYTKGSKWTNTNDSLIFELIDFEENGDAIWQNITIKHDYFKNVDPTEDDNHIDGWSIGSRWYNETTESCWVLTNIDGTVARWRLVDKVLGQNIPTTEPKAYLEDLYEVREALRPYNDGNLGKGEYISNNPSIVLTTDLKINDTDWSDVSRRQIMKLDPIKEVEYNIMPLTSSEVIKYTPNSPTGLTGDQRYQYEVDIAIDGVLTTLQSNIKTIKFIYPIYIYVRDYAYGTQLPPSLPGENPFSFTNGQYHLKNKVEFNNTNISQSYINPPFALFNDNTFRKTLFVVLYPKYDYITGIEYGDLSSILIKNVISGVEEESIGYAIKSEVSLTKWGNTILYIRYVIDFTHSETWNLDDIVEENTNIKYIF